MTLLFRKEHRMLQGHGRLSLRRMVVLDERVEFRTPQVEDIVSGKEQRQNIAWDKPGCRSREYWW